MKSASQVTETADTGARLRILVHRMWHAPWIFFFSTVGAAFLGGVLWNGAGRLLGVSHSLGGSGHEPHNAAAFLWGFLTLLPVGALGLRSYSYYARVQISVAHWFLFSLVYGLFGGLGGAVFYDSGARKFIEDYHFGLVTQELIVAAIWSFVISMLTTVGALFWHRLFPRPRATFYVILQSGFAIPLTLLFVIAFYALSAPGEEAVRGIAAGFGLRVGLLWGLIAAGTQVLRRPELVFLSYTRKDLGTVEGLYTRLRGDGYKVWLDIKDIVPGEPFRESIDKAINNSGVMLVCLSKNVRVAGFQLTEIYAALEIAERLPRGYLDIVPLRLEDCEVPHILSGRNWLDLHDPAGYERLTNYLQSRLGKAL